MGLKISFRGGKLFELIFFPSFCHLCGRLLERERENAVCNRCWAEVKPCLSSLCPSCGKFFEGAGEPHLCRKCLEKRPLFSTHRSCGRYAGKLKDLLLLYKYKRIQILGRGLADFAIQTLGRDDKLWLGTEVLIPVPLHRRREKERGFNQTRLIARELAKYKAVKLLDGALIKIKNVPPQTSLEAEERRHNVHGAYGIRKEEKIKGKILLLVDDVYTTGATLEECSRTLMGAGAKEVRAMTIAQA